MIFCLVFLQFLSVTCVDNGIEKKAQSIQNSESEIPNNTGKKIRTLTDLHFPSTYHAKGRILLPSANLVEPFEAWYSWENRRSRIDFYEGSVKTFHRADKGKYGTLYEIVPKFDYRHQKHYDGCWKKKGLKDKKVQPQGVIPKKVFWPFKMNLTEFKYVGLDTIGGVRCTKWVSNVTKYGRKNTYTFYASDEKTAKPIRYDILGYDIMLTSYYDNYTFEYTSFEKWKYNASVFELPKVAKRDRWCWNISKDTGDAGIRSLNPVGDLLDYDLNDDLDTKFNLFKITHTKEVKDKEDNQRRKHIFRNNLRYIQSINRRNLGFELGLNHFADLTDNEIRTHSGLSYDLNDTDYPGEIVDYFTGEDLTDKEHHKGNNYKAQGNDLVENVVRHNDVIRPGMEVPYDATDGDADAMQHNTQSRNIKSTGARRNHKETSSYEKLPKSQKKRQKENRKSREPLPREFDWRKYGAVGPVRSQAICGSCWSFSTTGAVESAHFLKTGKMVKLSEQQLLDCTWYVPSTKTGNNGCLGGWTWKALAFIKQFGLATEDSYGKYKGMEGRCNEKNLTTVSIDSYMKVPPHNPQALMRALVKYGPVAASINTSPKTLKFYKGGVYDDKACTASSDHSVLVVGYGRKNGKLYWIVKNSWAELWGDKGYILIRNGRCGLLNRPWAVITRNRRINPERQVL